jgi:hypothetical protein
MVTFSSLKALKKKYDLREFSGSVKRLRKGLPKSNDDAEVRTWLNGELFAPAWETVLEDFLKTKYADADKSGDTPLRGSDFATLIRKIHVGEA